MRSLRLTLFPVLVALGASGVLSCSNSRSLQAVTVSPVSAASQAQFTATGIYNQSPTSVDITSSITWCVAASNGLCAGFIETGATVSGGSAKCNSGFSGSVTVLAGQPGNPMGPDGGLPLKPFGTAELTCP